MRNRKLIVLILSLVALSLMAVECQEIRIEPTAGNAASVPDLPAADAASVPESPAMAFNIQADEAQPGPQPSEIIFVKLLDADHIECVSGLPQERDSVFEPLVWDINLLEPRGVVIRLKIKSDGSQVFVSEEGQEYSLDTPLRFSATNRHWTCPDSQPVTVVTPS